MGLSDSEDPDIVVIESQDVLDFNEDNILPVSADDLNTIQEWLRPTPDDQEKSEYSRHLTSYLQTILHSDGTTDKKLLPILAQSGVVDIKELVRTSTTDKKQWKILAEPVLADHKEMIGIWNTNPLHLRLRSKSPENALELLKYDVDVNSTDYEGDSALHVFLKTHGSSFGHVLEALLSAGADPNLLNAKGESPLQVIRISFWN